MNYKNIIMLGAISFLIMPFAWAKGAIKTDPPPEGCNATITNSSSGSVSFQFSNMTAPDSAVEFMTVCTKKINSCTIPSKQVANITYIGPADLLWGLLKIQPSSSGSASKYSFKSGGATGLCPDYTLQTTGSLCVAIHAGNITVQDSGCK